MYRVVKILCEGTSEEYFIKNILAPYLQQFEVFAVPITLGGVAKYTGIRKELMRIGKDSSSYLSTMLDYYKLPKDVPGMIKCSGQSVEQTAISIEHHMKDDLKSKISCKQYVPYIMMHEFEALLFSDVSEFRRCSGMTEKMILQLEKEKRCFPSPEHINNSEQTAPSKRILRVYSQYQKVSDGIIIAQAIGIHKMLSQCKHFRDWVRSLETLS